MTIITISDADLVALGGAVPRSGRLQVWRLTAPVGQGELDRVKVAEFNVRASSFEIDPAGAVAHVIEAGAVAGLGDSWTVIVPSTGPVSLSALIDEHAVDDGSFPPGPTPPLGWSEVLGQVTQQKELAVAAVGEAQGAVGQAVAASSDAEQARLYALGYRSDAQTARDTAVQAKSAAVGASGTAADAAVLATTKAAEATTQVASIAKGQPNGVAALDVAGDVVTASGKKVLTVEGLPDAVQGKADVATVYSKSAADAKFAPIDINAAGVIKHGSDPNVARGTAAGYRIWVGSVQPVNGLPGDVWVVATQKAVEPPISWFAQYRASTIGSADLATLTSWADSSGNARNLTQATAAKRPVFHVASGGVPAYITFDGSKNMQTAAFAAAMTQPYTLMMTVRMLSVSISASVTKRLVDGLDASAFVNFQQRGDGTNAKWQASAGTTVSGPGTAVAGGWAVVTLVVNGSGSKIRINGVEATGNVGAALLGGLTVGSKFDSTVFADFDTTDIRLASGLLSASQIASVEAALADSVGIILAA
jgi:hypothetical protein